jgi:hypothetical protein
MLIFSGFNEFIHERESTRADDPSIKLFDEVILSKRNRGKASFFNKSKVDFLADNSDHLWRTAAATPPNSRFPGDYREVVTRSKPLLHLSGTHILKIMQFPPNSTLPL